MQPAQLLALAAELLDGVKGRDFSRLLNDPAGAGVNELREAILTLIRDASDDPPTDTADDVDLMPWLAECPQAAALVRLAVRSWLEEL